MSIATLDHMKNLKINTLDGNTGHFDEEIDFAGHETPQRIVSISELRLRGKRSAPHLAD